MRTDVKIGIVLGLLVVAGIVVYFSLNRGQDGKVDDDQLAAKQTPQRKVDLPRFGGSTPPASPPSTPESPSASDENAAGGSDEIGVPPSRAESPASSDTVTPPGAATSDAGGPTVGVGPGAGEETAGPTAGVGSGGLETPSEPAGRAEPGAGTGSDTVTVGPTGTDETGPRRPLFGGESDTDTTGPPAAPGGIASRTPASSSETPADAVRTPGGAAEEVVTVTGPAEDDRTVGVGGSDTLTAETGSYEIAPGDSLWTIAEKKYGRGKGHLWELIYKANPRVDPNNLKVGTVLTIPPAPARRVEPSGAEEMLTAPAGSRIYIVKKGEGFWKIAERFYGNGALWTVIAKANPNLRSRAIREGQKVIVPPKPEPEVRTGPVSEPIELRPGYRRYRVRAGDILGKIAQEMYGSQRHWLLIAKANPDVEPSNLKIGTWLVIPPAGSGEALASAGGEVVSTGPSGPSAPSRPRSVAPDRIPPSRPDFGP